MKLVILAGGSGTRLWPVSRQNKPKQVQPFVDDETLLQKTYRRLYRHFYRDDIFIVTGVKYKEEVLQQLPEMVRQNIICEPTRKDTAAAIGLVAVKFFTYNPQEIVININADHFIEDESKYIHALKLTEKIVKKNSERGVLIGVRPTYPETGYGYIKIGAHVEAINHHEVYTVDEFIEKPNLAKAKNFLTKNEFFWNPGYFTWRVDTLLAQYKKFLPDMYKILVTINKAIGTERETEVIDNEFNKIQPISMDYGIIEKSSQLLVMPANFGFHDIGHWKTVKNVLQKNKKNIIKGEVVTVDSYNNLIYNFTHRLVATAGLKNMIIIATEDATLVCREDNAQDVKLIVAKLKELNLDNYL